MADFEFELHDTFEPSERIEDSDDDVIEIEEVTTNIANLHNESQH